MHWWSQRVLNLGQDRGVGINKTLAAICEQALAKTGHISRPTKTSPGNFA
jgi:hypothetical protein